MPKWSLGGKTFDVDEVYEDVETIYEQITDTQKTFSFTTPICHRNGRKHLIKL